MRCVILLAFLLQGCAVYQKVEKTLNRPEAGDCLVLPKGKWRPDRPDDWYARLSVRCVFN